MISLDTETTGVDFRHGSRPYFVTTCDGEGEQRWWEWEVDPRTREVRIPEEDVDEVEDLIMTADLLVLQNAKFDVRALSSVRPRIGERWPWERTRDTLMAGHLLASNEPHNLTDMALQYLGVDIEPYEKAVDRVVELARRLVRRKAFVQEFGEWRTAKEGLPDMPSVKTKGAKADMWLPRQLVLELGVDRLSQMIGHDCSGWETVTRDYANADSAVTLPIWREQEREIERRGYGRIMTERMRVVPVAYRMEQVGVTINKERVEEKTVEFETVAEESESVCRGIAEDYGYDLKFPKGGVNDSIRTFMLAVLELPPVYDKKSKSGEPTLNKAALDHYLSVLPERSKKLSFVRSLVQKRACDTALTAMRGYERFWTKWISTEDVDPETGEGWYVLNPLLNPTGTHTLRWSSANPNEQSISRREGFNVRETFGPAPGREWWSLDAKNIELRLPAYECGEEELVALFERSDEAPYYGSEHLLNFSTVYPEIWERELKEVGVEKVGPTVKAKYETTWYKYAKLGGFAIGYGALDKSDGSGTADKAFRRPGSQARLAARFRKKEELNQKFIKMAERLGYVETMPDRSVDPERGYPLMCTRGEWGRVSPTIPLNYHVQGTACWWMARAMVRCQEQLDEWRAEGFDARMVMQVHDELVFDLPRSRVDPREDLGKKFRRTNLWRVQRLGRIMAQGGDDVGVPTPVGIEYHPRDWGSKVTIQ